MNRTEAINFIENRPWQGSSLDLSRMEELMKILGNPQDKLKFIHVAGTNGKGSACALLTSILMKAGYKVGTFISPHLINYEERFSINNIVIDEKEFVFLTNKVKEASLKLDFKPRVFEILTAIAFMFFKRNKVDVVVLEVGMGGRLDATNIIKDSLVSIIMNIGLEHTQILGDTLGKIANEKAGIIKDNGDVVTYGNVKEVNDAFVSVAKKRNANLKIVDFNKLQIVKEGIDSQLFNYGSIKNIELSLLGKHQFYNASTVIEAINVINKKGFKITNKNIKDGLKDTVWNARLSVLAKEPLFIFDGAHNPQCVEALKVSLPKIIKNKKVIFLCGMLKDKDYVSVMKTMIPYAKEFVCVTPNSDRALDGKDLKDLLEKMNQSATSADTISDGIKLALSKAKSSDIVIAFGSLYLAGEVLNDFNDAYKDYLRKSKLVVRNKLSRRKVNDLSNEIVKKIKKSKEFKQATNILIYNSINNEVDLSELTKVKNKIFAYPKCDKEKLIPLIPEEKDVFVEGDFKIKEPDIKKSKVMKKIDMVICPLVCFDDSLNRIGYGKGYYDRFLNNKKVIKVGVAYEIQRVNRIPVLKHDQKLDLVITESKIYR